MQVKYVVTAIACVGVGCGSRATDQVEAKITWPKVVSLHATGPSTGDALRLADGVVVTGDGDLNLRQAMQLSLGSPVGKSFCEKGKFGSLAQVPIDEGACPGSMLNTWSGRFFLGGSSIHTSEESYVIGLSVLVFDASHQGLYRLRILGDSYDEHGLSTASFEYEPVR